MKIRLLALFLILLLTLSGCVSPEPDEDYAVLYPDDIPGSAGADEEQTPVTDEITPRYTVDAALKDPAITEAQRELFFELVKEWRVDAMYEFTPEKPMELEWFKYYCAYFVTEEEKTFVDMGVNYTGAAIERIAKWFGTSYGLKADEPVFVKAGSLKDLPFAELIQYKEEKADGKTLVTARCILYSIPDYYYVDWDQVETMASYPAHKAMILAGKVTGYETYQIIDFSFYTEDGKTPTQFVSAMQYSPESIEAGYQTLPEFVPAEDTEPDALPKETVTLTETPALERLADGVFYYGIQSFYPALEGKKNIEFREILKADPLAMHQLSNQAKKDSENQLCEHSQFGVMGGYSLDWEGYRYAEYEIINISDTLHSFWLICPKKTNPEKLFESMILMNAPKDSTIVRSTNWLTPLADGVYYLRIQRFSPTIDGKQVDFKELLKTDPQAVEKLIVQAKADAKKKLCQKLPFYDGGTVEYRYEDYTIIKFYTHNSETEEPDDYLEALVIAPIGTDYDTAFDAVFRGAVPI